MGIKESKARDARRACEAVRYVADGGDQGPRPLGGVWLTAWLIAALLAWLLPWSSLRGQPSTETVSWLGIADATRRLLVDVVGSSPAVVSLLPLALALVMVLGFNSRSTQPTGAGEARRLRPYAHVVVVLAAGLSGLMWTLGHVDGFRQQSLTMAQRFDTVVTGRVIGLPRMRDGHLRFALRVTRAFPSQDSRLGGSISSLAAGQLVLLNRYGFHPGRSQWIGGGRSYRLSVRLVSPGDTVNPGGFDYRRWLFRHGYVATGYVRGTITPVQTGWRGWLDRWRADLRGRLIHQVREPLARGLLLGLTLGDRSHLPRADWSVLLATGTNHLLAISGLHVGMMAGLFALLVGGLWRRTRWCEGIPAQRVAALAALVTAWAYALVAGLSIPTERAAIMLTILLSGVLLSRRWRLFDLWLLAAASILVIDPFAPLDAGFWLSFLAVLVIILWVRHRPEPSLWRRLIELQVILTLALWPLVWGLFDRVAWASVPANLLAVPLISWFVTPLALLSLATVSFWPGLSALLAQAIGWAGKGLFMLLTWMAAHFPDTRLAAPPTIWLCLALIGIFLLLSPRGWPRRWLGLLLLLPVLTFHPRVPMAGAADIWLFDVSRGTALLVRTRNHALLFLQGAASVGRVRAALRALGVDRIDRVEIGRMTVRQRRRWQTLFATRGDVDARWDDCLAPGSWRWNGVRLAVLPLSGSGGDGRSCVMTVRDRHGLGLMGADLDGAAATALAQRGLDRVDWLVVPHHGALSASPSTFVHAARPKSALISARPLNRWGYPNPRTLMRYRAEGARTHVTGWDGALEIIDGRVVGLRDRQWPFAWRPARRKMPTNDSLRAVR